MHTLVAEAPPELLPQRLVRAGEDEVHDLDRRVDDPKPIGVLLHGRSEELFVELHQHALAGLAVVQAPRPQAHTLVEAL